MPREIHTKKQILVGFQHRNWLHRLVSQDTSALPGRLCIFVPPICLRIAAQLALLVYMMFAAAERCLSERFVQIGVDVPFIDCVFHNSTHIL